ncbi:DUF5004 domain-containing protein [Rapidithrix thailandica]|uniref:DUF5004 domain-containing protein n=1 Tax=Rapidithrix thailandica TaxID=413964 RepID=A0AAW9S9V3_9BACT
MQCIQKIVLLFLLSGLLFTTACKDDDDPAPKTDSEKIASVTWKVTTTFLNNTALSTDDQATYANFRITFKVDGSGNPTTYTVTPGEAKRLPNYNSANTGNWTFSGNTITLKDAQKSSQLTVSGISETGLTLQWELTKVDNQVPPEDEGTWKMDLVPAQ